MPNTIAENLQRLVDAKEDIADAITAKGGTVGANDGLEEFASDIASIPSGGRTSQPRKDVNFYDYDGTIVNSYTAAEFANLSAMPSNPSHDGLTAQGWNWSLSDAKSYVASYGKLEIGQMYVTSDGKTRLYITLAEGRTSPVLQLYLNANSELDIDWGDGSTHSTFISTSADYKKQRHNYASAGDYVIVITVVSGGFEIQSSNNTSTTILTNDDNLIASPNRTYQNSLKKMEIGIGITQLGAKALQYCDGLVSITIPNNITTIGSSCFNGAYSLTAITIPNSVETIGAVAFYSCQSLMSIAIPNSVTSIIGNICFSDCHILSTITIPNSITSIGGTNKPFGNCYSLTNIIIPSSITNIGTSSFDGCYSLTAITIPNSVETIGSAAFSGCTSLAKITINKASGSISGSPWGASTSSPTSTQIIWTG